MSNDKELEALSVVSKYSVDALHGEEREDFVSFIKHELVNKLTDALIPLLDEGEKIVRFDPVTIEIDYTKYGYAYRQRLHVDDMIRCHNCRCYHGQDFMPEGWCDVLERIMRKNDFCSYRNRRTEK